MTCYDQYEDWHDKGVYTEGAAFDRYTEMLLSFARYVAGEMENPYTPDYELELFRTILTCCGPWGGITEDNNESDFSQR